MITIVHMHRLFGGGRSEREDVIRSLFPYHSVCGGGQNTQLHEACKRGDVSEVQRLLNNEEISVDEIQARDESGITSMYYAVESNSAAIVNLFLEKCPDLFKKAEDISEEKYNVILLQMAIEILNLEMMEDFLKAGCPVNTKVKCQSSLFCVFHFSSIPTMLVMESLVNYMLLLLQYQLHNWV